MDHLMKKENYKIHISRKKFIIKDNLITIKSLMVFI